MHPENLPAVVSSGNESVDNPRDAEHRRQRFPTAHVRSPANKAGCRDPGDERREPTAESRQLLMYFASRDERAEPVSCPSAWTCWGRVVAWRERIDPPGKSRSTPMLS